MDIVNTYTTLLFILLGLWVLYLYLKDRDQNSSGYNYISKKRLESFKRILNILTIIYVISMFIVQIYYI